MKKGVSSVAAAAAKAEADDGVAGGGGGGVCDEDEIAPTEVLRPLSWRTWPPTHTVTRSTEGTVAATAALVE